MKKNKITIAIDEMPLNMCRENAYDYNSMLIFKVIGENLFGSKLHAERNKNSIIIESINDGGKEEIDTIVKKMDKIEQDWCGILKTWFLGIRIQDNEHIYVRENNRIIIFFDDERRIYPFWMLLHSFVFYKDKEDFQIKKNKNSICVYESGSCLVEFKKVKNPWNNMLLYFLNRIDVTPNTAFYQFFYPFIKERKDFYEEKSGIEVMLVSTNKKSKAYNSFEIREKVFGSIERGDIQKRLRNILIQSINMEFDYESTDISEKLKISISYDSYYPNKIIVRHIIRQLQRIGICVTVQKTDFVSFEEKADFHLYLMPRIFDDVIFNFYYLSIFLGLKNNREDYRCFLKLVLDYYQNEDERKEILRKIKEIFKRNCLYYSLGEINGLFLCRSGMQKKSYEEMIRDAIEIE